MIHSYSFDLIYPYRLGKVLRLVYSLPRRSLVWKIGLCSTNFRCSFAAVWLCVVGYFGCRQVKCDLKGQNLHLFLVLLWFLRVSIFVAKCITHHLLYIRVAWPINAKVGPISGVLRVQLAWLFSAVQFRSDFTHSHGPLARYVKSRVAHAPAVYDFKYFQGLPCGLFEIEDL